MVHHFPVKRGLIWTGVVILVLAIALVAVWALRAPLVDAVTLKQAPLVRTLQFSARVASLSRVDIGSTVTARAARVLVSEGAQVRKDDVLIQLEADELRAAVVQATASERQAEARIAGLRSTGRNTARAVLTQAEATLKAAETELERTQQLVAQGFLSASRLDDARRAVDVAKAQQTSAKAQTQANDEAGTDMVQAKAQLALARAATVAARARLAQSALLAPADARVLSRDVEPGQIVQPGKALMSLALTGPTQLSAQVDERFLDQLQPGQSAAVVADAFAGQRFSARVTAIAPAVDAQRGAIEVKFALEHQAPAYLREDMTLSVEVETARRDRALVLPLSSVRSQVSDSSVVVWVAQDGRAQERAVKLGLRTLDAAEALEGLTEGDVVLLGGNVKAGARVRPQSLVWQPGKSAASGASKQDAGAAFTNAMGR